MKTFSAYWTDALGAAVLEAAREQCPLGYNMDLVGEDREVVRAAVNQGIDAHLEACNVPARGDRFLWYTPEGIAGRISGTRLEGQLCPESLVVLVRRLMESEDERGESLASAICSTLDIELV